MRLFEPIKIKTLYLKNRIVMPAIHVNLGLTGRKVRRYYVERARGGAAAITVAAVTVDIFLDDQAWMWEGLPAGSCAKFREREAELVKEVQAAGAKIGMQLWHGNMFPAGMWGGYGLGENKITGDRVGPSAYANRRAFTVSEIEAVIEKFARAALVCKEIGFDFVDFNGAHGYLMNQFFSPFYNRRDDRYGGDVRRRMQFGLDCVRQSRKLVGEDYPLLFRMGVCDTKPGGITAEDGAAFAAELEKAGADIISLSTADVTPLFGPISSQPVGTFVPYAEAVKKKVKMPVMGVGRVHTPELAEAYLAQNKFDLLGIGRQLVADPYYPEKIASGKFDETVTCLSCNVCLDTAMYEHKELRCSVNPAVAREEEHALVPAQTAKKVFVIGSGPAGMEAAVVASRRGHKVTLFEKEDTVGGQLMMAAVPPGKWELERYRQHMITIMEKAGVTVRKGRSATVNTVVAGRPDAVVVATGVEPFIPDIPGVKGRNVALAFDVLSGKKDTGKRVAVVGGELVGCETAELLAQKGKKVTVLRRGEEMAADVGPSQRGPLLERLAAKGVRLLPGVKYEEINRKGLVITNKQGQKELVRADTVVIAAGSRPNNKLAEDLKGKVAGLYVIGDCQKPGKIVDATAEGERVGREI
ncbi:MAG: FAD-dependent oxidoreductase [Chloroflexi bacterium]|nr:FAD-dependent oxidoreductase [Chloroflexota bacterium]